MMTSFPSPLISFFGSVFAGIAFFFGGSFQSKAAERPNILLILTDDQGFGDIASHGNPYVKTPVLDSLAASGARFDRFFVSPVCAPTRASLLTGRYHLRTGVYGVTRGYENIRSEEVTLAEILRENGYRTGAFGKWHNGRHMPNHPNGQGFQEFVGFCGGHWNTYFNPPLEHNGQPIETQGYISDILTDHALDFMRQDGDEPWFCYVPYNAPHSPWRVPDIYWERYEGLGLDEKAHCAYAMVENLDWNIGRLLQFLDNTGQAENTIVLYLTDNGANSPRYNAGMKGYKGSVDEGGVRVPLFVRYPGVIEPGLEIPQIAAHFDLLPTLMDFCGIDIPKETQSHLDGVSLKPLLTNAQEASNTWPDRMIVTDRFRGETDSETVSGSVRTQQWRAVCNKKGDWALFDMMADPGQEQDVSKDHPGIFDSLKSTFDNWFEDVTAEGLSYPSIPVGHPARDHYTLPANESLLEPGPGEGIGYTGDKIVSGFANSWIYQWTSTDAKAKWGIDVLTPGTYQATLSYTCKPANTGAVVSLKAGDQKPLQATVTEAYDPPLMKKPDHIYSDNYQDKLGWATLPLGELELKKGETELVLSLEKITGDEGIEVKALELTPVSSSKQKTGN